MLRYQQSVINQQELGGLWIANAEIPVSHGQIIRRGSWFGYATSRWFGALEWHEKRDTDDSVSVKKGIANPFQRIKRPILAQTLTQHINQKYDEDMGAELTDLKDGQKVRNKKVTYIAEGQQLSAKEMNNMRRFYVAILDLVNNTQSPTVCSQQWEIWCSNTKHSNY